MHIQLGFYDKSVNMHIQDISQVYIVSHTENILYYERRSILCETWRLILLFDSYGKKLTLVNRVVADAESLLI